MLLKMLSILVLIDFGFLYLFNVFYLFKLVLDRVLFLFFEFRKRNILSICLVIDILKF